MFRSIERRNYQTFEWVVKPVYLFSIRNDDDDHTHTMIEKSSSA